MTTKLNKRLLVIALFLVSSEVYAEATLQRVRCKHPQTGEAVVFKEYNDGPFSAEQQKQVCMDQGGMEPLNVRRLSHDDPPLENDNPASDTPANDNGLDEVQNYSMSSTITTSCEGMTKEECQLLHSKTFNNNGDISGIKSSTGSNAGTSASGQNKLSAEEEAERKSKWGTCYDGTLPSFKECVMSARVDLELDNKEVEFPAATTAAKKCQSVIAQSSEGSNWAEISKNTYQSGTGDFDHTKAVARFIVLSTKDSIKEITGVHISNAVKKVTACAQLAAVYGENIEAGRDEEEPYYDPSKLTSMDGRITCKLSGLETIDYDECAALVLAHNGAELGQAANTTFQQYEAQSLKSEQQQKLMNMDASSNVTTEALKAQRDGISAQQDMAEQRRALQATRLALIGTLSYKIPSSEDYFSSEQLCARPVSESLSKIDPAIQDAAGGSMIGGVELCKENFKREKFSFFRNSEAKRIGNMIAAEAGVDVAAETMAVSQLGKQKNMIASAIGKIEGMDTLELPEDFFTNEDAYMQFCTANPTHAECQSSFGATVNVPSFGDYNVGGFGTNQAYQDSGSDTTAASTAASTADPVAANVDTSTAVTKGNAGGGLKGNFGSGATVTEGGSLAQGAGGGGSNPGGGGGGGGSSAGDGGGQAGGTTAASGGTKGLSYVGGSGPSFVGGRGIGSRKPASKSGNPFENMFDKTKNRNLSSLNYNGKAAIGSKTDNLFQRISSAYDKANNDGNLLKYETKSIE